MIPATPAIRFHLAGVSSPLKESDPDWCSPIPLDPQSALGKSAPEPLIRVSYGDYFTGIRLFLERIGDLSLFFSPPVEGKIPHPVPILGIDVFEEKHGAFYHPARVEIQTPEKTATLALNMAVSETGNQFVEGEFETLHSLRNDYPFPFLPKVFHFDRVCVGGRTMGMFLGEWFAGYCEFHWAAREAGGQPELVVWDPELGRRALTPWQTAMVFRQAAMILSCYYHPLTFEHIAYWHHAAGDFVLKTTDFRIDVRLVSARRYGPLIKSGGTSREPAIDREKIIDALLLFFTQLCTRMRLDRLDGIGPLILAPGAILESVMIGFFEGLSLAAQIHALPDGFADWAKSFIIETLPHQVDALLEEVIRSYPEDCQERGLLGSALPNHRQELIQAAGRLT